MNLLAGLGQRPNSLDQLLRGQQGRLQSNVCRNCAMKFCSKGLDCHWDWNEVFHHVLRVVKVSQEEVVRIPSDVVDMLSSTIFGGYRVFVAIGICDKLVLGSVFCYCSR